MLSRMLAMRGHRILLCGHKCRVRMSLFVAVLMSALFASTHAGFNETELLDIYSGVRNWFTFSPRQDISHECATGEPLRLVYVSRHAGTLWDWVAVATHLGVSWTNIHPGLVFALTPDRRDSYESDHELAALKWRAAGQITCHIADIMVFGDITADARPLLQGNCSNPIILQVTNRFDIGVKDHSNYYKLMANVAARPNVFWVFNNPYEEHYMKLRGVHPPKERSMLLRPVGSCLLPRPPSATDAERASKIAFIHHPAKLHLENTFIWPWIQSSKLTSYFVEHSYSYGGPAVLAQHRGVIQVPYQVSVMKMYEGLAAGAVFILPSPVFFQTLLEKLGEKELAFCCRDLLKRHRDDWQKYMDWYHEDFVHSHVLYDSWEELKQIIIGEGQYKEHYFAAKKHTAKENMMRMRQISLEGWTAIYEKTRQLACEGNGKADVWSDGMRAGRGQA